MSSGLLVLSATASIAALALAIYATAKSNPSSLTQEQIDFLNALISKLTLTSTSLEFKTPIVLDSLTGAERIALVDTKDGTLVYDTTNNEIFAFENGFWSALGSSSQVIPLDVAIYVSTLGDDSIGTGTLDNPYLTIQRALDDLRDSGWQNTASIRILSTGGNFLWPSNLNLNAGDRGRQTTPLQLMGYNTNPNPGRSTVFSDTVASASADAVTGILDIVATTGGFTSVQKGQYLRFTSGAFATYPFLISALGEFAVDVLIVDVPDANTLRIAFSNIPLNGPPLPLAGDSFVVEAIDTQVELKDTVCLMSSPDRILLKNLVFKTAPASFGALVIESPSFVVFHSVTIELNGNFILSGYGGCTFMGGAVEFYNYGSLGFEPTTQSLFVNVLSGFFLTAVAGGPQNAPVLLANASIQGASNLNISGLMQSCYLQLGANINSTNQRLELGYSAVNDAAIGISRGGFIALPNVRITGGTVSVSNSSSGFFGNLVVNNISVDSGSNLSGSTLTLDGSPTEGTRINVSNGSILAITGGDVTIAPCNSEGINISNSAQLLMLGNVTSSGHLGHGAYIQSGSTFYVQGASLTCDSNGQTGVTLLSGSKFICGSVSASGNTGFGIHVEDSDIEATGTFTLNSNGSVGFDLFKAFVRMIGNISADSNGGIGVRLQRSQFSMTETLSSTGAGQTFPGVSLEKNSTMNGGILNIDQATVGLQILENSSMFMSDITVTNSSADNVVVSGNSSLTSNTLSSSQAGNTGVSVRGSTLDISQTFTASNNVANGLSLALRSVASLTGTIVCSTNLNGIALSSLSSISHDDVGSITLSNNTNNGVLLSQRSSGFLTGLTGTGNGNFGAECQTGSKLQVDSAATVTGTNGDAQVGSNATVSTWSQVVAQDPTFTTDYLSAQNPTQLCEITA